VSYREPVVRSAPNNYKYKPIYIVAGVALLLLLLAVVILVILNNSYGWV
jgi:hypothetical protein